MTLWRISDHLELNGAGGLWCSGRWHTQGKRVVYCALNPATCLLEILVHMELGPADVPEPLTYLEIEAPDTLAAHTVETASLGTGWPAIPASPAASATRGCAQSPAL